MQAKEAKVRLIAAHKLLQEESPTREKFESIRTLIKGLNPRIDSILEGCSEALTRIEQVQKGEIIELSAETLPENSEEEKKRKKALLWFINSWKSLRSEVERVKNELETHESQDTTEERVGDFGRIVGAAKGPFGIITAVAVVLVGTFMFINQNPPSKAPQNSSTLPSETSGSVLQASKIKVIEFSGKQIPLSEVAVRQGPDCMVRSTQIAHYHAKDHRAAKSLDGSMVTDPGGCGFGKVDEVAVVEVEQP